MYVDWIKLIVWSALLAYCVAVWACCLGYL